MGSGAPRQITPRKGDQFTILEQWYTEDAAGDWEITEHEGDTLTYSGKPFTVEAYEGYEGEYSLGILVDDTLDNEIAEYATVVVVEKRVRCTSFSSSYSKDSEALIPNTIDHIAFDLGAGEFLAQAVGIAVDLPGVFDL